MTRWWKGERTDPGPPRGGERLTVGFVARGALVVIALWALASMLWLGRDILFVAFFGVLFAIFLSIFVNPMVEKGVPRVLAVLLVFGLLISLVVFLFWLAWPTLQAQAVIIRTELPNAIVDAVAWVRNAYFSITGEVGRPSAEVARELRQGFEKQLSVIVAGALPFLHTAAGAIFGAVLTALAGLYLAIDPETYVQGFARLVPPAGRARFIRALYAVGADLRHWLLGTAINMLLIGIMITVGLLLLGIPAAFALGMIALFLEFIPIYGPWLSAIPAVLVALITSPADAFWVAVLYLCVQEVEAHVMSPLVMKGAVRIPPMLTLLIGAFMAVLFGFLGLVLAVPLLATAIVLLKRLYIEPLEERAAAGEELPPPPEPHPGAA